MTGYFSETDHERIATAIRAAENETTGEIVCVVARSCEPYSIIAAMWAALAALVVPVAVIPICPQLAAHWVYSIQGLAFLGVLLALQYMPLRMALVPKAVKLRRAERLARTQFLEQGLHRTEGRTGVLIFAAMAEHHVEVIADAGINDRVEPGTWDGLVSGFAAHMKRGETVEAFVDAVGLAGAELKRHFPKTPGNPNELPDRLIEI